MSSTAPTSDEVTELGLRIEGMTCASCVAHVESALKAVPGVQSARVNLATESATVRAHGTDPETLVQAVRSAGYDATPAGSASAANDGRERRHEQKLREGRQAIVLALGIGLPIMLLHWFGHTLAGTHEGAHFWPRFLQALLTIMLLISPAGGPILVGGARAMLRGQPNMDSLIGLGVAAATIGSLIGLFVPALHHLDYFHEAAMILGIINIGKYLELKVRARAASSLSALIKRVPRRAMRLEDGRAVEVGVDQVRPGDHLRVGAESYVPVDGTVASGSGAVDMSMWTGEAVPVEVSAGDEVLGGAYVVTGALTVRARGGGGSQSAIARIAELVEAAQASKTRMQRLADRVSAVFVPLVVAIAILTFAGWMIWSDGDRLASAISAMIAVLVIACPCAMGLATPAAVMVATGSAALRGIIVRDAAVLEAAGACDVAVLDKTGTLTTGQLRIDSVDTAEGVAPAEVLQLAASAEQFSPHPIAKAIVEGAGDASPLLDPTSYHADAGLGVLATIDGRTVAVGSRKYLQSQGISAPDAASTAAVGTQVFVARDGAWIGTIVLTDTLRPEARAAIEQLKMLGIEPVMVTGDAQPIAERIARSAGIDRVQAGVSPEGKAKFVKDLQSIGRRVLMVGDGINDAPALAAADVGIAMAGGTEVATETAPITLVGNRLDRVPEAAELARKSVRIIRENLFWAFIYNVVAIPLAAFGVLPAGYAAAAMMFSDISVILNSLRLKYSTPA